MRDMRLFLPLTVSLLVSSLPLLAAPNSKTAPPKSIDANSDALFIPAMAALEKIRAAQKTLKPTQKFNLSSDDPRLAPSLEFNAALLKVVNSSTASTTQKRAAIKLWDDFYQESGNWKPYYFVGTSVPKHTFEKMRDFAFSQIRLFQGSEAEKIARQFSTLAVFALDYERTWQKATAQELLANNEKGVLREWALQIQFMDKKVPLAERLKYYRELMALKKLVLTTRDYYFTSFISALSYSVKEEKETANRLRHEVFTDGTFLPKTRFDAAISISVAAPKSEDKIAIYDQAMKIEGLETIDKWSLLYWRGNDYTIIKAYDKAVQSFDEAAKLAGAKLPKQRAEANFAAAKLKIETLKKPQEALPFLNALANDEHLNNQNLIQVVLWRTNQELDAKNNANARKILEQGLLFQKLTDAQKDYLRFQLAQVQTLDKNHASAIEIIEQIPVQNLDPQVQQGGFDAMFGILMSQKNFDGAKAIIDVWSKRGGLGLLDYTLLNGFIFESRGDLPTALAVYKAVLPNISAQKDKDDLNAAISKIEAKIAEPKPQNP
jgi:hypothetical protein